MTLTSYRMLGFGHYQDDTTASTIQQRDHKYATDLIAFSHTQGLDPQPSQHHFPTLRSEGGGQAVAQPHVVAPSLTASNNPSRSPQSTEVTQQIEAIHQAQPNLAVRRLTPLECERLMGWPDNHTLHRTDGKPNSDSTRYRMCGNGVVAPVAQWIAKHLKPLL